MAFDLSTAHPVDAPAAPTFDLSTAKPAFMPDGSPYTGRPDQDALLAGLNRSKELEQQPLAQALTHGIESVVSAPRRLGAAMGDKTFDAMSTSTHPAVRAMAPAVATAVNILPDAALSLAGGIGGAGDVAAEQAVARAGEAGELSTAARAGFRTAEDHPVARAIAGTSGKDALTLHNQQIGDTIAANEANVPAGQQMAYDTLKAAREPANAVYQRAADHYAPTPESIDSLTKQIDGIGQQGRLTSGSPDAAAKIAQLRTELKEAVSGAPSGDNVLTELRALREEGSTNLASEDVSNQTLGKAQLQAANALEDHLGASLPKDAPVTLDQFQTARTAIAKNYGVQAALRGNSVDMGALARVQRNEPELLTGGLKTIADFANENPAVTALGSRIYQPPGFISDVAGSGRSLESILSPSFLTGVTGAKALARRILTGTTSDALDLAGEAHPSLPPSTLAPIEPPTSRLSLAPDAPIGPRRPQNYSDYASVLSQGVGEPTAAPSLSLAPYQPRAVAPNFAPSEADRLSGELSLLHDKYARGPVANLSDYAAVRSQGVPEDILQRTPRPGPHMGDIDLFTPAEDARRQQLARAVNESGASFAKGGPVMAKEKVHHIKESDLQTLIALLGHTLAGVHQRRVASMAPPQRPPMAPQGAPAGGPPQGAGIPPGVLQRLAQVAAMRRMQGAGGPPGIPPQGMPPPQGAPPQQMPLRQAAFGGLQMGLNRMEPQGQFTRGIAHSMNLRPNMGVGMHPLRMAVGGYIPQSIGATMPPGAMQAMQQLGPMATRYGVGNPQRPMGM